MLTFEFILGGSSAVAPEEFAETWRAYRNFVKLRNVDAMSVDPNRIQRQTPRILADVQTLCEHLDRVRSRRK